MFQIFPFNQFLNDFHFSIILFDSNGHFSCIRGQRAFGKRLSAITVIFCAPLFGKRIPFGFIIFIVNDLLCRRSFYIFWSVRFDKECKMIAIERISENGKGRAIYCVPHVKRNDKLTHTKTPVQSFVQLLLWNKPTIIDQKCKGSN